MDHNKQRLNKALDALIFLPHLRDRQAKTSLIALIPGSSDDRSSVVSGINRPWDQRHLFKRLQTFKPSTWFAKPECISPIECARRGWHNTDADMLSCESCNAVLSCPIPPHLTPEETNAVAKKFCASLIDTHDIACPWKSTACSLSLLNFPEVNPSAARIDFRERLDDIARILCLPSLSKGTIEVLFLHAVPSHKRNIQKLLTSFSSRNTSTDNINTNTTPPPPAAAAAGAAHTTSPDALIHALTNKSAVQGDPSFYHRAMLVALCGWTAQPLTSSGHAIAASAPDSIPLRKQQRFIGPESATLVCHLCGAKAGLWMNFADRQPCVVPSFQRKEAAGAHTRQSNSDADIITISTTQYNTTQYNTTQYNTPSSKETRSPPHRAPPPAVTDNTRPPPSISLLSSPSPGSWSTGIAAKNVMVDLSTTIAGGKIDSPPFVAASATPMDNTRTAVDQPRSTSIPVFGFAALRAVEPVQRAHQHTTAAAATRTTLGGGSGRESGRSNDRNAATTAASMYPISPSAGKRRLDPFWDDALGDIQSSGKKRTKGVDATAVYGDDNDGQDEAIPLPSHSILQQYRSTESTPLDIIGLHRQFCPWVHVVRYSPRDKQESIGGVSTGGHMNGWQWYAHQLAGECRERLGDIASIGDDGGEYNDGIGEWNPSQVLRDALSKVEVRK